MTLGRWFMVRHLEETRYQTSSSSITKSNPALPIRERTHLRTQSTAAATKNYNLNNNNNSSSYLQQIQTRMVNKNANRGESETEDLPHGCERPEWQEYNFPNCNDIHEIDLPSVLSAPDDDDHHRPYLGYVSSGLWRSVWSVNPRGPDEAIVLKMMELEHDVTARNFDRHRRDALTMEMLSSSPYVVDGYGFCGNSVLTEFLDLPLDHVMTKDETDRLGTATTTTVTKITPRMRVQWALDVAKGVQALHEVAGGPIVHADIQSKQFLVSPTTGRVKINDFNRCRFMGQRVGTTPAVPCPFRIPSAPGKMRAPEEYKYDPLTEKLDIYSVANILYSLLTKERPWEDLSQSETKQFIKKGKIPKIWVADDIPMPDHLKQALVHINERAYQLDPRTRISAAEMAEELEKVLEQLEQLEPPPQQPL